MLVILHAPTFGFLLVLCRSLLAKGTYGPSLTTTAGG
jgi:hypothetical protein